MDNKNILLRAEGVSKYYNTYDSMFKGSGEVFKAVDNISLELVKGECAGIVGESGSGKSTFAKILAGILQPDEGKVYYKNIPINNKDNFLNFRSNVQVIFQNPDQSLNPKLKVLTTLKELIKKRFFSKQEILAEAERLMSVTGLSGELLTRYPHELSGGQKQRVSIARALALKPEVIIADEPVSSLDVSVQAQVLNLMYDLTINEGITFILISHDFAVVRWLCPKIAVIKDGNLLEYGDTENVIHNPSHEYTKELIRASSQ